MLVLLHNWVQGFQRSIFPEPTESTWRAGPSYPRRGAHLEGAAGKGTAASWRLRNLQQMRKGRGRRCPRWCLLGEGQWGPPEVPPWPAGCLLVSEKRAPRGLASGDHIKDVSAGTPTRECVCLCVHLSVRPSIYLSMYPSVHLFIRPSVQPSAVLQTHRLSERFV